MKKNKLFVEQTSVPQKFSSSCEEETLKPHGIGVYKLTTLLFEWPIKTAPRLTLPLFIFLAVLLHLSTVYFFNIVYDPPQVNSSTTAQVFFLPPGSPSSHQLAPWLQANDPAIFSPLKTVQANHPKIQSMIYQLKQPLPVLRPLPSCEEDTITTLFPPTEELTLSPTAFAALEYSMEQPTSKFAINKTTTVRLLENNASPLFSPFPMLGHPSLPPGITTPLHPTTLTVNIDELGIPRHVIISESSGNEAADEAATHWLMTSRFAPSAQKTWEKVLIFWGSN